MAITEQFTVQHHLEDVEVKNYDMPIILGYSIFAIVFLIVVYFDSVSPGTALGDFASTIVFQ
ncbi:hypothetical protein [Bradyrhizobium sp. dw_411]|uniref:hypothetical protein n=1 Tax=Bradyrhizobium sp. dw_411 TaxID=2720082 RepID=UPI001BCE0C33|nr:hypothetical protein [Bradyrhizobium sp. dw_411]